MKLQSQSQTQNFIIVVQLMMVVHSRLVMIYLKCMVNQIEHKCLVALKYQKVIFDSNIAQNGYGGALAFFLIKY